MDDIGAAEAIVAGPAGGASKSDCPCEAGLSGIGARAQLGAPFWVTGRPISHAHARMLAVDECAQDEQVSLVLQSEIGLGRDRRIHGDY